MLGAVVFIGFKLFDGPQWLVLLGVGLLSVWALVAVANGLRMVWRMVNRG